MGAIEGSAATTSDGATTWEHPYAELREATHRRPAAWLAVLHATAEKCDPLLVARIPAVHRKLTAAGVPHVLPLLAVEREGERLVLVHRHEHGESLAQRLERGRLPVSRSLAILRAVCRCIAAAHRIGIEHRALGPASVLLGTHGDDELWITDFGIAELCVDTRAPADDPADDIDALDLALHPMTPERARCEEGGPAEDVYLIGCLAYWMIAGVPPFAAVDLAELAERHADESPRSLAELAVEPVPFTLLDVVARALRKRADDRHPDLESLDRALAHAQLEAGVADSVPRPRVPTLAPRQTHPFGTDPPRPLPRSLALELERLPATMLITPEDRAELPAAPGVVDREVTATLRLPPVPRRRLGIVALVAGLVAALAILALPVDEDDADEVRTASAAARPPRAGATVRARAAPLEASTVPTSPAPAELGTPAVVEAAVVVEAAIVEAAVVVEPAAALPDAPALASREAAPRATPRAAAEPTRGHAVVADSASPPEHQSADCQHVRKVAEDAREGHDWNGLLRAASRPACWCERNDAHALRIKALMEIGAFAECASAVRRLGSPKGELARTGEICRRRAAATLE